MFSLKRAARPADSGAAGKEPRSAKKRAPGELRIQKDISELDLDPETTTISFPDKDNFLLFHVTIRPKEGFYSGAAFDFAFEIPSLYPHEAPKVKCLRTVYHPNIDLDGNICLNILREDWKPILSVTAVVDGLQHLFLEPNPDDPLNKEAGQVLKENKRLFAQNVTRSLRGGLVGGHYFEPNHRF